MCWPSELEPGQVLAIALTDERPGIGATVILACLPQFLDLGLQGQQLGLEGFDVALVGIALALAVFYLGLVLLLVLGDTCRQALGLHHFLIQLGQGIAQAHQALLTLGDILLQQVYLGLQVLVQLRRALFNGVVHEQENQ